MGKRFPNWFIQYQRAEELTVAFWKMLNRLCRLSNRLLYFRRRVIMNEYVIMSFHDVR
jgi:hypothetical protein